MKVDELTLMSYVDGELSAEDTVRVDAAVAADSALARRVAAERELRATLSAAFDAELSEPVPEQLLRSVQQHATASVPAAAPAAAASVIDLQAARTARAQSKPQRRVLLSGPWFASLAASVVVGLFVGYIAGRGSGSLLMPGPGGQFVASGTLASALTTQLSGDAVSNAAVRVGISYRSKTGDYCRTFSHSGGHSGIACRRGGGWQVELLAHESETTTASPYRTAGSGVSPEVLRMVEQQIAGEALDRSQETAARSRGWRP